MSKNVLAILAHPDNKESFNAALLESTKQACLEADAHLEVNDLYANNFNPVLSKQDLDAAFAGSPAADVRSEQEKVAKADVVIFHHPVFWFDRPAILKGWFDRVLTNGFAFHIAEHGPKGLLKGKRGLVIQTAGTPPEFYAAMNAGGYPQAGIERGTLGFCGMDASTITHYNVLAVSDDELDAMKAKTKAFVLEALV